jgi:membrane fusion protein, multidrug efflux system
MSVNRMLLSLALLAPLAHAQFGVDGNEMRAQLTPVKYAALAAEMPAKVERVTMYEGQAFKRGDVLVAFDCEMQRAQLQKMQAQLFAAETTLTGNERLSELNAIGAVELNTSLAEVQKAKADVAYLQATVKKCTISAPFDGRAGDVLVREQQFVKAGDPLLNIFDDSALELEFILPSSWLVWLDPGHRFEVNIEDTGNTYPARLKRLSGHVDPLSHTVKAVAVIDGDYAELLSGMSGFILLTPPEAKQ